MTVIGLGAMGSALAGAFLDAGHSVTVWNRTPGKGDALAARGAVVAATAEEAVTASELIVVCLVDYDASEAILTPLAKALSGRTLVNVTADVPDRARTADAWAAEHGIAYLDGAVMVPTAVVGTPAGLLFYSGDRTTFERYEPVLRALGGRTVHVGDSPDRAAVFDVALLDLFYGAMGAMIHAFALARAHGVPAAEVVPYMTSIVDLLPEALEAMAGDIDARSYPALTAGLGTMAASVDHIVHAGRAAGIDSAQMEGIQRMTDRARDLGHADSGWAANYEALINPRTRDRG
ncbi:NAD(P)-dependent oxidoreductase [Streptomyces tsukubensis]|uniref:NAD(P)-dependent oxidoreductase n=1 Tax=Streptomyces tsukubensis TaxID=83656 RepID=UPI00367C9CA7